MRSCDAVVCGQSPQMCSHGALEREGKEKAVLMLQAAFKRPAVHSAHQQTPHQSLEWDKVKPEDKTLVHQVRFINQDTCCYCFHGHLHCIVRAEDM